MNPRAGSRALLLGVVLQFAHCFAFAPSNALHVRHSVGSTLHKRAKSLIPMCSVGTDEEVRQLLSSARTIAVVGATNRASMPVHGVMNYLIQQGYRCIPINPREAENGGSILGQPAVARVADIKEKVDMVDIFLRADRVPAAVDDAISQGAGAVWTQLNIEVEQDTVDKARAAGMVVVTDRCPAIEIPSLGITPPARL